MTMDYPVFVSALCRIAGTTTLLIMASFCVSVSAQDSLASHVALNSASSNNSPLKIVTENFPPYNYSSNNQADGFVSELVQACQAHLHHAEPIDVVPWPRAYRKALSGKKVMIYSINRLASRENLFKWVGPVAEYHVMFFARKNEHPHYTSLEQLRKIPLIGVTEDSAIATVLLDNGFNNLSYARKDKLNVMKAIKGRVDLWLGSSAATRYQLDQMQLEDNTFEAVGHLFSGNLYLGFSNSVSDETVKQWQQALAKIQKNGTYARIEKKYQKYLNWEQKDLPVLVKTL